MIEDAKTLEHALADYRALQDEYERMSKRMMVLEDALTQIQELVRPVHFHGGVFRSWNDGRIDTIITETLKSQTPSITP